MGSPLNGIISNCPLFSSFLMPIKGITEYPKPAIRACFKAATYDGFIDGISKACLTDSSCFYAARDDASIGSGIKNCECDTCAGALDDASLPDECGDKLKLDFGELFDGSTRSSSPRSAPKTSVVPKT